MKHLPNTITVLRILCVPILVVSVLRGDYAAALICIVAMGASDALDGFLAKTYGWCSYLGEQMDPLADMVLLVSAFVSLAIVGLLPIWLVALVALRDFLLVGFSVTQLLSGGLSVRPVWMSKINTFFQIVLVISVLAQQLWPVPGGLIPMLIYATTFTVIASGVIYLRVFLARTRWSDRPLTPLGGHRTLPRTPKIIE